MNGVNNFYMGGAQSTLGLQGSNAAGTVQDTQAKETLEKNVLLPLDNIASQIAKLMQEMQKCFKQMNDLRRDAASHTQLEMSRMQVEQFDKQMKSIDHTAWAGFIKGLGSIAGGLFTMASGGYGGTAEAKGMMFQGAGQLTTGGTDSLSTVFTKWAQQYEAEVKVGDGAIKTLLDTIDQRIREVEQASQDMRQMLAQLVTAQKDLANSAQIH